MRIQATFVRPILVPEVNPEPIQNNAPGNIPVIAQDQSEKKTSFLEDLFFHPKGVGQSSTYGQRSLTPDQIQNMTKEELAERERRKKMADAGMEAGTKGANLVGGLAGGRPVESIPTTVISEVTETVVEEQTTAPEAETPSEPAPAETKPTEQTAEPKPNPQPQTEPKPVPQKDIGVRLNPDYIGIIDIDPRELEKKRFWPEPPKQDPKPVTPRKRDIRLDANLKREMDTKGDADLIQLQARGLLR